MTSLMYNPKVEKKIGGKVSANHASTSPHNRIVRASSLTNGTVGNNLSVEILEVRQGKDKQTQIVGGPYICMLEVIDPSIHQTLWKQKSSAQFTTKPPIIFGDVFKVKTFSGEWSVDIKSGFVLKIQLCQMLDKTLSEIDSAVIELSELVVNKEQQKVIPLDSGKAEVVLRLNLSNTQYPRGNTLTLSEIDHKEKEKEEEKSQPETPQKLERTLSSYSLPRVNVRFSIHYHTHPGEDVRVVGSNYKLGDWDASKAPVLEWTHGDMWVLEVSFRKAFVPFEYKYVVFNNHNGSVRWENVPSNRKLDTADEEFITRSEIWEKL
jgi:hypothetical protein